MNQNTSDLAKAHHESFQIAPAQPYKIPKVYHPQERDEVPNYAKTIKYRMIGKHSLSVNFEVLENAGQYEKLQSFLRSLRSQKRVYPLCLYVEHIDVMPLSILLNFKSHWSSIRLISQEDKFGHEILEALARIGRCKNLSTLDLPLTYEEIDLMTAGRISRQIKKLKRLKRLDLTLPLNRDANLKPPPSLQSLTLTIKNSQQTFFAPMPHLERCTQLEELALIFPEGYPFELLDAQMRTSFFQKASSIKRLALAGIFAHQLNSQEIQAVFSDLKHLKNLTSLEVYQKSFETNIIKNSDLFYKTLFTSFESFTHLQKLENLDLKFDFYAPMKSSGFRLFTAVLRRLKNLKRLTFNFSDAIEPLQEGLAALADGIRDLALLEFLSLRFSNLDSYPISSLKNLFNDIAHLNLTSLHLDLGSPYKEEPSSIPGVSAMKSGITKITNLWKTKQEILFIPGFNILSSLKLNLESFHISTEDFKHLAVWLKQMRNLSSLTLLLLKSDTKTNLKNLQNFLPCFKEIQNLTVLSLSFTYTFHEQKFSDEEVKLVASNLIGCRYLETLILQFFGTDELTSKCFPHLQFALSGLLTLKWLDLRFAKRNHEYAKNATLELLNGLVVLENLEHLDFADIRWHVGKNTLKIASLPIELQGFQSLKHLKFFAFRDCCFIGKRTMIDRQ